MIRLPFLILLLIPIMHFPIHFIFFNKIIYLHSVLEVLGLFVGFSYFQYLHKKNGDTLSINHRTTILIAALFGSVLGSRVVGVLENVAAFKSCTQPLAYFFENKSIAGGLLGGLWGVEIVKIICREKQSSGDLFVFPLISAMIIGRVGCWSMGVYETTYGLPTKSFLGMDLGDHVLRHPVMLYEMVFLTILFLFLKKWVQKRELKSGSLFQIFIISYFIFRFLMEFLKPKIPYFYGLGTIQITCLLGLFYYLLLYLFSNQSIFKKT